MGYSQRTILIITFVIGFFCYGFAIAEITVEPLGFAVPVEEDGEAEVELVLSNSGEDDIAFSIDYELIVEEDDRQAGPRRDDPGDVLEEYEVQYDETIGLAWDDEHKWMWGIEYVQSHIYAINPEDGDVEVNFATNLRLVGLFFLDGVLHAGGYYDNPHTIYRYDTEGEALDPMESPVHLRDVYVNSDGEFLFTCNNSENGGGGRQINVHNLDDMEEVASIDCGDAVDGDRIWAILWVTAHPQGQLWMCGIDRMYQCYMDDDWNCEAVQDFAVARSPHGHTGIAHDGDNLWRGIYRGGHPWYVIDDGVREFDMLVINPESSIIPGENSETVEITVQSEGYEAGVYNILIEIKLSEPENERDDLEQSLIEISAVVTVGEPTYSISGVITGEAEINEEAVVGATIEMDVYLMTRFSDNEGNYGFENLPPGDYTLTFTAADFLPTTEEVTIEEDDVELDIALLHSRCLPSEESFSRTLGLDETLDIEFNVHNSGNGPLTYHVDRRLLGEANAEPWQLRAMYNTQQVVGDDMINGVTFAEDHFYVSGGNNGGNPNMIYIFDNEGEQTGEFEHVHESRYGMRDLTYDGNLIWGSDENILYGYTTDGEHVETLDG
ncbi:carboxypeptidase regulatory-like domain-containing protein, partial [bacterium]|nr:carboxypeptidase regulatory-like domain-containing protein [bacterium]